MTSPVDFEVPLHPMAVKQGRGTFLRAVATSLLANALGAVSAVSAAVAAVYALDARPDARSLAIDLVVVALILAAAAFGAARVSRRNRARAASLVTQTAPSTDPRTRIPTWLAITWRIWQIVILTPVVATLSTLMTWSGGVDHGKFVLARIASGAVIAAIIATLIVRVARDQMKVVSTPTFLVQEQITAIINALAAAAFFAMSPWGGVLPESSHTFATVIAAVTITAAAALVHGGRTLHNRRAFSR